MTQWRNGWRAHALALAAALAFAPAIPVRASAQDARDGAPRSPPPAGASSTSDEPAATPAAPGPDVGTTDEQTGAGAGEPVTGSTVNGDAEHAAAAARGDPTPASREDDLLNEVWSGNGGG